MRASSLLTAYLLSTQIFVEQDPVITVTKGGKAHLRCRFSTSGNSKVGTFTWYRNAPAPKGKEVNNDTHPTGIIKEETSFKDNDASIYILETLMQYAGTYYCEVDLVVKKATGNGTRLVVKMPENKPNSGELECICRYKKYSLTDILGKKIFRATAP
uniref:Natural cytotoxicity triggering receptor 3 n=1 Tax=Erpetoichthys calabaricus TaxID=27687 RepID=A0A8C4RSM4_ERPCA